MKRIVLSACLILYTIVACAQLTSGTGKSYTNYTGIDYLFIFNGITPSSEITYSGNDTNINWYKYSDNTNSISNQASLSPEDATGYILNDNDKETSAWVIDFKNYLPAASTTFEPDLSASQCTTVNLNLNPELPLLTYKTPNNISYTMPRNCTITYNTLKWGGTAWQTKDTTLAINLPSGKISVPAPYCTTTFTLSGDQFAKDLKIDTFKITSATYTPEAVICHITTNVTNRDHSRNNEVDAPSHATPISFSAPIDVQFQSNANVPVTLYYNWEIYKDNISLINRKEKDQRYTFTEAGTYKVKLTVSSNATCSYSDSVTVIVSESALYVPNVFTPNGDGKDDEFRVTYKSLISFQCWVYNRWGREVYSWTDPTKGWDGNINGRKASPGPYFYIIKAVGSDKKVYKLKGDINLLR